MTKTSAPASGFSEAVESHLREEIGRMVHLLDRLAVGRASTDIPADVWMDEDRVRVRFEIPGADPESLQLNGSPVFVEIAGRKEARNIPGGRFVVAERTVGPFRKAVELPGTVDLSTVQARLAGGVMTIDYKKIKDRRGKRRNFAFTIDD
ncbi:MAG: Hsp20/alpha crystallin family protein [Deltaproteobacteria bacterium]|nr:Hsp20/alpha crystallin family protein [bacterium]MCB9476903.1 Hsp20/alpha crystallin family protein [Deltaproteobacteria bacterium]MCB9489584.1 Hsp20/alpha crystallin family protein [Deltaproteobacteria bacterium]